MIIPFVQFCIAPVLYGLTLVTLMWPNKKIIDRHFIVMFSASIGIGLGISSILFFLWLLSQGGHEGYVVFERYLIAISCAILYFNLRKQTAVSVVHGITNTTSRLLTQPIFMKLYALAFFFAVVTFFLQSLRLPHGRGTDAMTIWNMRARFLFRSGLHWEDAFAQTSMHGGYPLNLPLNIARGWECLGNDSLNVSAFIAFLFTFATIALVSSSISSLRGTNQGLLAGLALLGTPFFIQHGGSQYADVPLGFFFVSSLVFFSFYDMTSENNKKFTMLSLAGLSAAFAAWTKNEGLVLLIAILFARLLVLFVMRNWKNVFQEMVYLLIGMIPVVMVLAYFKFHYAPPNDLLAAQNPASTTERLLDISRYITILRAYIVEGFSFTHGLVGFPLFALLLFFFKKKDIDKFSNTPKTGFIAISFVLMMYFVVYLTTPHDLSWHLSTSLSRLLLQLWPSFIFCVFLIMRTPIERSFTSRDYEGDKSQSV